MFTRDDLREMQMDSESKSDFEMEIDEVYSSDVDINESDNESAPKEQSINRNCSKTDFKADLFHFDEQNAGVPSNICAMKARRLPSFARQNPYCR